MPTYFQVAELLASCFFTEIVSLYLGPYLWLVAIETNKVRCTLHERNRRIMQTERISIQVHINDRVKAETTELNPCPFFSGESTTTSLLYYYNN